MRCASLKCAPKWRSSRCSSSQGCSGVAGGGTAFSAGTGGSAQTDQGSAGWRWVLWLVLAVAGGLIAFVLLNKGGRMGKAFSRAGAGMEVAEELAPHPADDEDGRR